MQNYKNHSRIHIPYHFVLAPFLLIHLIYTIVRLYQDPSIDRAEYVLLALALNGMLILIRLNSLKVQDRLIRLEERVRYARLLPAELAVPAENLPLKQILALRFASDAELPALVTKVLNGEIQKPNEIKQSVGSWRPDELRV